MDADLERRNVNGLLRDFLQVTGLTTRIGKDNIDPSVRAAVTAYHECFGAAEV